MNKPAVTLFIVVSLIAIGTSNTVSRAKTYQQNEQAWPPASVAMTAMIDGDQDQRPGSAGQGLQLAAKSLDDWGRFVRPLKTVARPLARGLRSILKPGRQDGAASRPRAKALTQTNSTLAIATAVDLPSLDRAPLPIPRPSPQPAVSNPEAAVTATKARYRQEFGLYASFAGLTGSPLAAIGVIVILWRRQRRRFANSTQAIRDAITGLPSGEHALCTGVEDILDRIENLLGLSRTSLIVIDRATWQAHRLYASGSGASGHAFVEEALAELRERQNASGHQILWHYPEAAKHVFDITQLKIKVVPDAVGCIAWVSERLGVFLVAELRQTAICKEGQQVLLEVTPLLGLAVEAQLRDATPPAQMPDARNTTELAGRVAHEFRNVLTSITGYAEKAADVLQPGSSPHRYVENIQKAGHRAQQIVEETLRSGSRRHGEAIEFDAVKTIDEILTDLHMCVPAATRVHAVLPDRPLRMYGRPAKLQQIVINLCKNAGEAMKTGGTVTVEISPLRQTVDRLLARGGLRPGTYVRISVTDDGPGIPEKEAGRIFEPHFTTRSEAGGTGQGLSVVLDAVLELGGAIDLWSRPRLGSKFELYFPARAEKSDVKTAGWGIAMVAGRVGPDSPPIARPSFGWQ